MTAGHRRHPSRATRTKRDDRRPNRSALVLVGYTVREPLGTNTAGYDRRTTRRRDRRRAGRDRASKRALNTLGDISWPIPTSLHWTERLRSLPAPAAV